MNQINRSNDLLNLEKKLEAHQTNERILNKFILKPNITAPTNNKDLLGNLSSFLENFKKSNEQLLSDSTKLSEKNIEVEDNKYSKNGMVKMVLIKLIK